MTRRDAPPRWWPARPVPALAGTGLLADDLYLIAHHERTGRPLLAPRAVGLGLAGALLAELVLAGAVTVDAGTVASAGLVQADDALTAAVAGQIAGETPRRPVVWLAGVFSPHRGRGCRCPAGQRRVPGSRAAAALAGPTVAADRSRLRVRAHRPAQSRAAPGPARRCAGLPPLRAAAGPLALYRRRRPPRPTPVPLPRLRELIAQTQRRRRAVLSTASEPMPTHHPGGSR